MAAVVPSVTIAVAVLITAALIVAHGSAVAELLTGWPIVVSHTGAAVCTIEAPHLVGTDVTVALSKSTAGAVATTGRVISALPLARRSKVPVVAVALPVRRADPLRAAGRGAARDVAGGAEEPGLALAAPVAIAHAIAAAGHQRCALPVTVRSKVCSVAGAGPQVIARAVVVAH